jgi:hypothetical protein
MAENENENNNGYAVYSRAAPPRRFSTLRNAISARA